MGLVDDLAFHDVYSLDDPQLLAMIPRPCYALLATVPMTPSWKQLREREDAAMAVDANGKADGDESTVVWFKQTISDACGMIGLLHCLINVQDPRSEDIIKTSTSSTLIKSGSLTDTIHKQAAASPKGGRHHILEDSTEMMEINELYATQGDTKTQVASAIKANGNHYVAFVKDAQGVLWELEGSRPGPIRRGVLSEDQDLFDTRAMALGLGRYVKLAEENDGAMRFSCTALAAAKHSI